MREGDIWIKTNKDREKPAPVCEYLEQNVPGREIANDPEVGTNMTI